MTRAAEPAAPLEELVGLLEIAGDRLLEHDVLAGVERGGRVISRCRYGGVRIATASIDRWSRSAR